ncbi:TetR/AcrR family transcriptional regulator [Streptomyces sp. CA-132043]|uniref:TetR/AcrR family transcriptional regulator n=1 Tax=Streptomyces sp. CA-132043 TaxID=3240048 RepID=UPI003D90475D
MVIAEAAAELFSDRGYEATTVEHIAAAAGISLRTFYRYCPAKEDALTPVYTASVSGLVDQLAVRPADEPLVEAVGAAFTEGAALRRLADAERARRLLRVMGSVPALRTRWLAAGRDLQDRLAPVLAPRTDGDPDSMETRLLAAALIDALTVAMEFWAREQHGPEDQADEDVMILTARALRYLRIDDRRAVDGRRAVNDQWAVDGRRAVGDRRAMPAAADGEP